MSVAADMQASGWTVSGGVATATSGTTVSDNYVQNHATDHALSLNGDTYYKVKVDVTITSGTLYVDLGDASGGNAQKYSICWN